MFDVLAVHPEHAAIVSVTTHVSPNSATNWGLYKQPQCQQLYFFDTRRNVADLVSLVWTSMFINHTMTNSGGRACRL